MSPQRLMVLVAATCAAVWAGAAAHAGMLASASVTLRTAGATGLFPGVGATGTATSATSATLGAGTAFRGTTTIVSPDPTTAGKQLGPVKLVLGSNAAGSFAGATPAQVGGEAGFKGLAYLYSTPNAVSPFVGFKVVAGESYYRMWSDAIGLTVFGAPWTAGAATIDYGNATMPATLMVTGMNALNSTGAGLLTLVSPGKVHYTFGKTFVVVSTLTLTYVPEPATALLLGAGTVALALLGHRRGRTDGA
jgi:hypothetical protein